MKMVYRLDGLLLTIFLNKTTDIFNNQYQKSMSKSFPYVLIICESLKLTKNISLFHLIKLKTIKNQFIRSLYYFFFFS